jgi:hypothetical protein
MPYLNNVGRLCAAADRREVSTKDLNAIKDLVASGCQEVGADSNVTRLCCPSRAAEQGPEPSVRAQPAPVVADLVDVVVPREFVKAATETYQAVCPRIVGPRIDGSAVFSCTPRGAETIRRQLPATMQYVSPLTPNRIVSPGPINVVAEDIVFEQSTVDKMIDWVKAHPLLAAAGGAAVLGGGYVLLRRAR